MEDSGQGGESNNYTVRKAEAAAATETQDNEVTKRLWRGFIKIKTITDEKEISHDASADWI